MGFHDVAFLPYLSSCGRGESFGAITCFISVVGGKQGHAPCDILLLQLSLFEYQSISYFVSYGVY